MSGKSQYETEKGSLEILWPAVCGGATAACAGARQEMGAAVASLYSSEKAVQSITGGRAQNTMRMPSERYRNKMKSINVSADHTLAAQPLHAAATSARTTRALAQQTDPWP